MYITTNKIQKTTVKIPHEKLDMILKKGLPDYDKKNTDQTREQLNP